MAGTLKDQERKRARAFDMMAGIALTVGAIVVLVEIFVGRSGFDFGWVVDHLPSFLDATQLTFYVTTVAFGAGLGIGFLLGWARTARWIPLDKIVRDRERLREEGTSLAAARIGTIPPILLSMVKYLVRRIGDAYVEIIRGTPLFVQIVFIWSILLVNYPRLEQKELLAGLIALTANTGGYQSEIFRAGLQTVHSGQVEAGRAIGLSRWGAMRHVVLPQALRLIIPPLTNEYIGLLKASSLLIVIGVSELTGYGRNLAFTSFKIFEVFAVVTAIYLLITVPVSKIVQYFEVRYRIPGLGIQQPAEARV